MSQWSDQRQVQDRCHRFPLDTDKIARYHAQPAANTLLLKHLLYISTILPPPTTTIKKICKEEIEMKFNICLQQNCDQSPTVSCSKWSSERNSRVREWRLTWNVSADSNRANRNDKRHPPPMVVSVGKKTTFIVTGPTG